LLKRSPHKALKGRLPEQVFCGEASERLDLSNLRVFGCKAEIKIPSQYLKKLDDRSEPMMFVGYCDESKGYRFINLERPTQVVRARDAVFYEDEKMPCQSKRDFVDTVDDFLNLDQCKRLFGLDFGKYIQASSDPGNEDLPNTSSDPGH